MTISGGRTKQLDIIADFLPCHWLYEWFLSADICVMHDDLRRQSITLHKIW